MTQGTTGSGLVNFDDFVAAYERIADPLSLPLGVRALDLAQIGPGTRVVDVAAGTGALAQVAAERGARVLATDIAPGMVARAEERLRPFPGCGAQVMDYRALELPDGSFDAAISIVGVLVLAEGTAGLRELARVTRPGGHVVAALWDQDDPAAPHYFAHEVFAALFPGRHLWPEGFFPRWPRDTIAAGLREAGCDGAEVHIWEGEWRIAIDSVMDNAIPTISRFPGYQSLDEEERRRFAHALAAALARHAAEDGVARLTTRAAIGVGRLPA